MAAAPAAAGTVAPAARPASGRYSAAQLELALRTNPNQHATVARCARPATARAQAVSRRAFASRHALTFTCQIAVNHQPAALFDVEVLHGGCFVAERRRRGQADYGCIHTRAAPNVSRR